MKRKIESRTFVDEHGRLWNARYVPDSAGVTLPDAKILEFIPAELSGNHTPTRVPVRPGFLESATEEQLRAALAASI